MNSPILSEQELIIRPIQYRDLDALESWIARFWQKEDNKSFWSKEQWQRYRNWFGLWKILSWFPKPYQHDFHIYVAQRKNDNKIVGAIQVSPFNCTRSTWQVEQVIIDKLAPQNEILTGKKTIGSQLLRYCLENIWEARTWVSEVEINDNRLLALYRENGFQPIAHMTYWSISKATLQHIAQSSNVDLPNLLPVSNTDAQLLHQLDCVSMPPLLRQVFDRHKDDFKVDLLTNTINQVKKWFGNSNTIISYVFEPQRKAAIGYFSLKLATDQTDTHQAKLTVHPAYTWLYPKLLAQMAYLTENYPPAELELISADYQPEREEYLRKLGAKIDKQTLLMSRSIWHKLRESKPLEALHLPEVLQGLQPARPSIPTRISPSSYHNYQSHNIKKQSTNNSLAAQPNIDQLPDSNK